MARKTVGRPPADESSPLAVERERSKQVRQQARADGDMATLFAELQAAGEEVVIYRYSPVNKGQQSYITTIPAADFSLEWVRRRMGGGRYLFQAYADTNGTGKKIVAKMTMAIEGKPKDYRDDDELPAVAAVAPAPAAPTAATLMHDGMLGNLMAMMAAQSKAMLDMAQAQRAVQTDPLETAVKLASIINKPSQSTPVDEAFKILTRGIEMGQDRGPIPLASGDDGVSLDKLIGQVLQSPLAQAIAQKIMGDVEAARAARGAPLGAEVPAPSQPALPSVTLPPADPMQPQPLAARLSPLHVGWLLGKAVGRKDPYATAVAVLNELPDAVIAELGQASESETFAQTTWADAVQRYPQLAPHAKWFGELLTEIRAELQHAEGAEESEPDA